jgi:hypothetical protein
MSGDELRGLAHDLYNAGAIGLSDSRLLSLEPATYASDWPGWSVFETPGESDGRRDWIREIQARILRGSADPGYVAYQQALLSFLERVQAARPGRTGPSVETLMRPGKPPGHSVFGASGRAAWWPSASR